MRPNEDPKSGSSTGSTGSRDNSRDGSRGNQKPKPPAAERRLGDFLCFAIYSANLAFGLMIFSVIPWSSILGGTTGPADYYVTHESLRLAAARGTAGAIGCGDATTGSTR